ncbi:MAG TPA: hypothetical protein VGD37_33210 [Kofleriaceae bacterium]
MKMTYVNRDVLEILVAKRRRTRWVATATALGALVLASCIDHDDGAALPDESGDVGATSQAATAEQGGLSIQLLDKPDVAGNTRVTVVKPPEPGTQAPPYLVVGETDNPIILRDDGLGADLRAQDFVYSGFANVDMTALAVRNRSEVNTISEFKLQSVPTFDGRAVASNVAPAAFDFASFQKGVAVAFNPSIIFAPASPAPSKSLLVNDPNVVGTGDPSRTWDPCSGVGTQMGAFTFGHLMTEMANQPLTGINPSNFVMQWLRTWQVNQSINTFNVPARTNINTQIINPWLAASGGRTLDLGIAPFRLLAIVNRLDLRTGSGGYGGSTGNAGELRFVFGAVKGSGRTCQLLPFTVILEYGVPIQGCVSVRSWAQQWVNLNGLALGSAAYNAALQAITDQVVLRNDAPGKPNGSALNQLRTNEIALASPWELRQFNLTTPISFLRETPVFQTPDRSFNAADPFWSGSTLLDTFVMSTPAGATVPLSFLGTPFLGGAAPVTNNNLNYFWNFSTLNIFAPPWNDRRFQFSLNTCNGCHAGETRTVFTHISPTSPLGSPAALSGFLTGITVTDPAAGAPNRTFNDLARRQSDLVGVANSACLAFPKNIPELVQKAFDGGPLPIELVAQPVAPVAEQGTLFVEDFFKAPIQGH